MTGRVARRLARHQERAGSPLAHLEWREIRNPIAPVERLSPEQVETIHRASMRILEEIGIAFMDAEALSRWDQAGAEVDHRTQMVRIDREMLAELIARARPSFRWRARDPAQTVTIGGDYVVFVPHGGMVFAHDADRGRRQGTLEDYHNLMKIEQASNLLHFTGDQLVVPHDIEVSARHLQRSLASLTLSDRCYSEAVHGRVITADAIAMAQIVFGQTVTETDEPVVGGVINASSPLRYDERMCGGLLTFAAAGQALIMTPFILAGAMSPVTMAAAITQQNAEALAGIALTQIVRPGAPVIYGGFATNIDLRTGNPAFGTPEGAWAMMVGAQLARYYRLPYRGSGSLNTSKIPDAQAAYETMWSLWPAVLGGTNFVMHACGWLEGGLTVGYEKVVLDLETLAIMREFLSEVEISDETLAFEMIRQVGPGGHHFGSEHTIARYEHAFFREFVADRQNYGVWQERGAEDAATRANQIWKRLLDSYEEPAIDVAIKTELTEYVTRRTAELDGVNLYE